MVSQKNPIYKCNCTKVVIGIKKSNRAKIRGWGKSGNINKKSTKEDSQQFVGLI